MNGLSLKMCCICKNSKNRNDFYKCSSRKDGLQTRCKNCDRLVSKKKRLSPQYKKTDRQWRLNNSESIKEYQKVWQKNNKIKVAKYQKTYRAKNRQKFNARMLLYKYVAKGKIIRGRCAICNSGKSIEAHHEDYSKPLEVVWLCKIHHNEIHRRKSA